MSGDGPDFDSPAGLQEALRQVAARLHHINRVAAGESRYVWHLAALISAAGRLAELIDDSAIRAEFGDGWTPGTIPREGQTERMLALLRERL